MVDRNARDKLRQSLARLVNGEMTNDQFDDLYFDEWTDSKDLGVNQIANFGYGLYSSDTLISYRLSGRYAVCDETRQMADRCVQFLSTDLECEWPKMPDDPIGCLIGTFAIYAFGSAVLTLFIVGIAVIADLAESMTATKDLWKLTAIGLLALAGIWLMPILGRRISRRRRRTVQIDWECWPFFCHEDIDTLRQTATSPNGAESDSPGRSPGSPVDIPPQAPTGRNS